jgi:hypothetical protein
VWETKEVYTAGGRDLTERDHLEDLGLERSKVLKWIFRKLEWGMDWIYVAQDRDR